MNWGNGSWHPLLSRRAHTYAQGFQSMPLPLFFLLSPAKGREVPPTDKSLKRRHPHGSRYGKATNTYFKNISIPFP